MTNELSLPQRLREQSTYLFPKAADTLMREAADEIDRLRSALEELSKCSWDADDVRLFALEALCPTN